MANLQQQARQSRQRALNCRPPHIPEAVWLAAIIISIQSRVNTRFYYFDKYLIDMGYDASHLDTSLVVNYLNRYYMTEKDDVDFL